MQAPTGAASCMPVLIVRLQVDSVLVYANDGNGVAGAALTTPFTPGRDEWWQQALPENPALCDVEWVPAEHPLFLLYTSGSTGAHACTCADASPGVCACEWAVQVLCTPGVLGCGRATAGAHAPRAHLRLHKSVRRPSTAHDVCPRVPGT